MDPNAPPFVPTFSRLYSRAALLALEPVASDARCAAPPPAELARLFRLRCAAEFLRPPLFGRAAAAEAAALRRAGQSRLAPVVLQSGDVVWAQLQLALVFEARQSSLRMRLLAERHPRVVQRVRAFLCGDGYHPPLPRVTAHEEWRALNEMLRFDWIRDSRTRIFTELSKRWKRRLTQFEQFVHFYGYRDDRPTHPVKNMITHSVKPVMVALLAGDELATVLLARLGFFVPPDYYWDIFPFFAEALIGRDGSREMYEHMRSLCRYLSERQRATRGDMFNPIEPPTLK